MKLRHILKAMPLLFLALPATAQDSPGLGEVVVTASRSNARYAEKDRPVVGLRRQADSLVYSVAFGSDTRDFDTRRKEIHTMLLAAIDKAPAAGIELVVGGFELAAVSRTNYDSLPLNYGGRPDTSRIDVMVKTKLAGSAKAAEAKLDAFIKALPRTGRGTIDKSGNATLTIVNPDQYRDAIVQLVADSARRYAAMFGPEYGVEVTGIDGQVFWSQVSSTDVFLYVPYHYTVAPK